MVIPKLIGRTGNQAFQIATVIAYAKRHDMEYHIPANTLNDKEWPPTFTHLTNSNYNPNLPVIQISEFEHNYSELPFSSHYKNFNIVLSGYFQSEKYFLDAREEVLQALRFPKIYHNGICSLHVRRGDYLRYADKHPPVTETYLTNAIDYISKETNTQNIHVFSDDIPWCKAFFSNPSLFNKMNFSFSEGKSVLDDLYSIAQCEHHIISNSTYSFWGAYASCSPFKKVIAPEIWFGPANVHLDSKDILLKDWIKL